MPTLKSEQMLLSLHIVKIDVGIYRSRVLYGHEELCNFDAFSIGAAIRAAARQAQSESCGYTIWYEHVSVGSCLCASMRLDYERLEHRLMAMHELFEV